MTPFAAGTNANAALASVHDSLSKLRATLSDCLSQQAAQALPDGAPPPPKPSPPPTPTPLTTATQQALVHVISAKVSHDAILRDVDLARTQTNTDQELLLRSRSRLASLRYERALLEREIASCRSRPAPALSALPVTLPTAPEGDDARVHRDTLAALDAELARRRAVRKQVEDIAAATQHKRDALAKMKTGLRAMPHAVRALTAAAQPMRKLLDNDHAAAVTPAEVAAARRLPAPLYVLAREALAYRAAHPGRIDVDAGGEDGEALTESEPTGVYRVDAHRVRVAVHLDAPGADAGTAGPAASLEVVFQYHVELQLVSVLSRVVRRGAEAGRLGVDEVQMLFPYDVGEESPKGCDAHLEGGRFRFDEKLAGGARPFVWANLVCGVACLPAFAGGGDAAGEDGTAFAAWPGTAGGLEGHVRFTGVVEALRGRVRAIVALRMQVEAFGKKRLAVPAAQLGFEEPKARIEEFCEVVRGERETGHGVGREGTGGRYTAVWGGVVCGGALRVKFVVGVEPDYPGGTPLFRVRCEKGGEGVCERDFVELEVEVNRFVIREGMGAGELLLTGQMMVLLKGVDRLVEALERKEMEKPKRKGGLPASLANLLC